MAGLYIVSALMLIAGSIGVYLIVKKYCWRETLSYIPVISASVFAVVCAVLVLASANGIKNRSYEKGYGEGMEHERSEAEFYASRDIHEETSEDIDPEQIYADAYANALRDFAEILGPVLSGEPSATENDGELRLITDDEVVTEEGTRSEPSVFDEKESEEKAKPEQGTTVYYTKSGNVIHKDRNCRYLKNSSGVISADISDAPKRKMCSSCG